MRSPSVISPTGCAAASPSCRLGRGTNACSRARNAMSCSSILPREAMMWASPTAGSEARPGARCASSNRRSAMCLALLLPAQAQFWGDGGGRPQRQQQYNNNWNNNWFGGGGNERRYDDRRYYDGYQRQEREAPVDYSRAPPPSQKKPEATTSIVVTGDANADWLAYGLEDAFSENPDVGIVRKHRTDSGLIRYDQRRDLEWPQVAREIIAAEKPKFIVMMIGNNDRQTIREKAPPAPRPGAPKPNAQAAPAAPSATPPTPPPPPDPEQ